MSAAVPILKNNNNI